MPLSRQCLIAAVVADMLQNDAVHVQANSLPGYERTEPVRNVLPDIIADSGNCRVIVVIATRNDLKGTQLLRRCLTLAIEAEKTGGLFVLAVNKLDNDQAIEFVQSLNIDSESSVIWTF